VFHTKSITETKYLFRKWKLTILINNFCLLGVYVNGRQHWVARWVTCITLDLRIMYCFIFKDLLNIKNNFTKTKLNFIQSMHFWFQVNLGFYLDDINITILSSINNKNKYDWLLCEWYTTPCESAAGVAGFGFLQIRRKHFFSLKSCFHCRWFHVSCFCYIFKIILELSFSGEWSYPF